MFLVYYRNTFHLSTYLRFIVHKLVQKMTQPDKQIVGEESNINISYCILFSELCEIELSDFLLCTACYESVQNWLNQILSRKRGGNLCPPIPCFGIPTS